MFGWSIIARACSSAAKRAMHLAGVHARLDDLQSHLASDRLLLEGHVDDTHAPFADFLEELVGTDLGTRRLRWCWQVTGRLQREARNPPG